MNSFAGIFWLVLAQLQNRFFVEHLPVAAYVRCLKEKEWKKWNIVCFYCTQSDILLCDIARFSRGNKNKLRTFLPQKWKKIKNSQPQTKFTDSHKKRVYFDPYCEITFSKLNRYRLFPCAKLILKNDCFELQNVR